MLSCSMFRSNAISRYAVVDTPSRCDLKRLMATRFPSLSIDPCTMPWVPSPIFSAFGVSAVAVERRFDIAELSGVALSASLRARGSLASRVARGKLKNDCYKSGTICEGFKSQPITGHTRRMLFVWSRIYYPEVTYMDRALCARLWHPVDERCPFATAIQR